MFLKDRIEGLNFLGTSFVALASSSSSKPVNDKFFCSL